MSRLALFFLLPLLLGGCVTTQGPGSVTHGECKVFEAPRYAIRGATQADQDWIDPTIESGIGACKWARPVPRPAAAESRKAPRKVAKTKKKRGWIWRELPKLSKPAPAPPVPLPAPAPEAPAPPAPPPRSALDELLRPSVQ